MTQKVLRHIIIFVALGASTAFADTTTEWSCKFETNPLSGECKWKKSET